MKSQFVRFLDGGVKFKCGTVECNAKRMVAVDIEKEAWTKRQSAQEQEDKKRNIVENQTFGVDNFIRSTKQYLDFHTRLVDPTTSIMYKQHMGTLKCTPTDEQLSEADRQAVAECTLTN